MNIPASSVILSFASPDGLWSRNAPLEDVVISGTPVDEYGCEYDIDTVHTALPSGDCRSVALDRVTLSFTHPDTGDSVDVSLTDFLVSGEPVDDDGDSYLLNQTLDVDFSTPLPA